MPDGDTDEEHTRENDGRPVLDYRSAASRSRESTLPSAWASFGKYFLGVAAGLAIIAVGYFATQHNLWGGWIAISFMSEVVAGLMIVIFVREWRPFGIGLITALPLGLLLFVVGCFILVAS